MQIAHQIGVVSFKWVIRRMMQLHTVRQAFAPAMGTDSVEHRRKLAGGFGKLLRLCGRRFKSNTDRALQRRTFLMEQNAHVDALARTCLHPLEAAPSGS